MQKVATVLLNTPFPQRLADMLATRYTVLGPIVGPLRSACSIETLSQVNALLTLGSMPSDAALFETLPNLRILCCSGSGYDGVDLQAAAHHGVLVTYSPAVNAGAVADLALGLLIASIRRIVYANGILRAGLWRGNTITRLPQVHGLTGRKVGIYGMGAIGKKVAQRAAAFDMEIGHYSRSVKPDVPGQHFDRLIDLAHWADVLMITVRGDASTRHSVNAEVLNALGLNGHVINVSRGMVIDELALIDALQKGVIGGAALDVYEHEPQIPDALRQMDHVVLTPHIAGGTIETQQAQQDMMLANLDHYFTHGKVLNQASAPIDH